jgi:uncharacterized membrane protein YbhN (UPF0104 family)
VKWILRALVVLVVVALCVLLLQRIDLQQVKQSLRNADWRFVALAVAVHLTVDAAARVQRWAALLAPLPHKDRGARFWELAALLFASYSVSNLLPARAGEALRPVQLHRRHGYAFGQLVSAQLIEKLVEVLSLALIAWPVAVRAHDATRAPLITFAALGTFGVLLLLLVARRLPGPFEQAGAVRALVGRVAEGMRLCGAPRVWVEALAWSCVSDLADVAMVGLCMLAVGIHAGPGAWLTAFLAINLAIAVPSTPGHIGVLEAGAVLALSAIGVPAGAALAFAVLYHAAHVLPTTLVGLLGLRRSFP